MIEKYPASLKLITILVNHTTADKNNTWKHKEEDCGGNKPKLGWHCITLLSNPLLYWLTDEVMIRGQSIHAYTE